MWYSVYHDVNDMGVGWLKGFCGVEWLTGFQVLGMDRNIDICMCGDRGRLESPLIIYR
jgi:hypothetical protein